MSGVLYRNLSLLLPVYKGGELFIGAIRSVEELTIEFDHIFISFNGEDRSDYEAFNALKKQGCLKKSYTIFHTNAELPVSQHGCFVLGKIEHILQNDSLLMPLAHDDRIIIDIGANKLEKFISELSCDSVCFPSYSLCDSADYKTIKSVYEKDANYSVEEFFWLSMKENLVTNMSGMILPFSAYQEAVHAMAKSGSGARAEHLFCTASSIRNVQFTKEVSVLIGERDNSDGKTLSRYDHRFGSLIYVWSYAKNGHLARAGGYLSYFVELSKKLLAYGFEIVRRSVGFSA